MTSLKWFPVRYVLIHELAAGLCLVLCGSPSAIAEDSPIGRWDLVMHGTDGPFPSWLEVRKSGHSTLVGSFVGQFGSARPIAKVDVVDGNQFQFAIPPQWEKRSDDQVLATLMNPKYPGV